MIYLLILTSSLTVFCQTIIKEGKQSFLVVKDLGIKEGIIAGDTSVEKISDLQGVLPKVHIYQYLESEAGTKEVTKTFNCAAFDERKRAFLFKDKLCKTITLEESGKQVIESARFTYQSKKIRYEFEELTEEFSLTE